MNEEPDKPKRRWMRLVVVASVVVVGAALATNLTVTKKSRFIWEWSERFRGVESLEAAKAMAEREPVIVRTFTSGEWFVATCEHSCCAGAGFDATVIRDSTGAIYAERSQTFCGVEGLAGVLGEHAKPAESLKTFYAALELKLERR